MGSHPNDPRRWQGLLTEIGSASTLRAAGWSSLAARRAHNPKVIGSNPIPATNI
jgi:hypothetical protein